jgi:cysteinyl-tRNA synthetase
MALRLYSTLTRKKELFKPLREMKVGMYSCGPTVYNYAHIGNLRTYVFNDLLKRSLGFLGYSVKHVMNITDVDDKTIKKSGEQGESLQTFTRKYEAYFFDDLKDLNIVPADIILRATENISYMVNLIEMLLKKKYAYIADDGVYFSIEQFKNYGKLAHLHKIKKARARIKSDEYDKAHPQDFALWKFYTPEDNNAVWDAPFGKGRPGWHIECSAMSMKVLGKTFDIHTGGADLIFPHHENEIAQSECATGKKFVKYWMHSGFLTMKEGKMAKSIGNVVYLLDIKARGYDPLIYRYLCLTAHYRKPLAFSFDKLGSAKKSYLRLKNIISFLKNDEKLNEKYLNIFRKAIENDLDMPNALAALWRLLRDKKAEGKLKTALLMDEILGLKLAEVEHFDIPEEIKMLVEERDQARKEKNWMKADLLRKEILEHGYQLDDTPEGVRIKKSTALK